MRRRAGSVNLGHIRFPDLKVAPTANKPYFAALPKQREFMQSHAAENLYSGAVRAGKSRALMEKCYQEAVSYPGIRLGVFRKVRATLYETTIRTFACDVLGWGSIDDPQSGIVKRWRKSELKATLYNGSEIIFLGMDKNSKIGSLELGGAFVDEAHELEVDDWNMIQTRLSQPVVAKQRMWAACNPASPMHWLYEKFFRNQGEDVFCVTTNSFENPHLGEEYIARLTRMTGNFYRRMALGEWVAFSGLIFDCFDADTHVVAQVEETAGAVNIRSIDFGGLNPHVCQWWRVYPDGKMVLYRELYHSNISIREFADKIHQHQPPNEQIQYTVSDHDVSDRLTLAENNIQTRPALKDVKQGLERTYEKMANGELFFYAEALVEEDWQLKDDTGAVNRIRPKSTLEELGSYEWHVSAGVAKDQPVKKDDHGMDAMRYAVQSLYQPQARWSHIRGI
jgi:PBSX family phage terminase large subunit